MIVVMSGLDGAGKSTQIVELTGRLQRDNIPSKVIWARGGYTPLFELAKKILRKFAGKKLPPPGISEERKKHLTNPRIQKIWLTLAILDLILVWGVYARLMHKLGIFIVCDRYINDTLLDFRRNFPNSSFEKSKCWAMLKFLTPKPDFTFVLWVPVELSLSRSIEKSEPFPDDIDTLSWRLHLYLNKELFPEPECISYDGRLSVKDIATDIYKHINMHKITGNHP